MSRLIYPYLLLALVFGQLSFAQSSTIHADVLKETNAFRKSKGLPPLQLNDDLNRLASSHSQNMAKGRTAFGHRGFNSRDAEARRKIPGVRRFAENVALGVNTGREVVNMWRNSFGHRRNLLGAYKYMGIGTARDRNGRLYFTQLFGG